jgi:hypothetical protein
MNNLAHLRQADKYKKQLKIVSLSLPFLIYFLRNQSVFFILNMLQDYFK